MFKLFRLVILAILATVFVLGQAPVPASLIKGLVVDWCDPNFADRSTIINTYGSIEDWDVSQVTTMEGLFSPIINSPLSSTCNPDISSWDVSGVTTLEFMVRPVLSTFNYSILF